MRPDLTAAVVAARSAMARSGRRPVVVAHDVWLAAGLDRALPETALVCIAASDAVDHLRAQGAEVFCLSEVVGPTATAGMSSLELLSHSATKAFFASLGPTAVIAFKPSERIAAAVSAIGGHLLSAAPSAARAYENKLAFVAAAERAGVPRPRWEVRDLPTDFAALESDYGPRVVIQAARGNAGQRTWSVSSQADLDALSKRRPGGQVRVAEYLDGAPFTASGVTFSGAGTGLDRALLPATVEPCRQVTAVPWLTPEPLGSCGNAWGAEGLAAVAQEVKRCLQALGADLAAHNYRGVFGVDFVLAQDGPVVIEVNPRMVASLPLATELEVEAGRAPLLLLHLLELIDADPGNLAAGTNGALGHGSQVILHRLPGDAATRPPGGIYRWTDGALAHLRPGASLRDIDADDELLLVTRRTGEPVTDRKEFARIVVRSPLGEGAPGVRPLVDLARQGAATART